MDYHSQSNDKIKEWAVAALSTNDQSNIETIVETPWSCVLKINSSEGPVYLKQTPPGLFIEAEILKKYRSLGVTTIPEVIAENKNLNCFLMKKCGDVSLRTSFNDYFDVDLLIRGLHTYREMQKATTSHVDTFIKLGVPDWRLKNLPELYRNLVSDEAFLKSEGMDEIDIRTLQRLTEAYRNVCDELASYAIPESLNHGDFHDNNILIDKSTQQISIIDLGETTIDHPLLSLASCFSRMTFRYNLSPGSPEYQKFYDVCFNGWLSSSNDLEKVLSLIDKLLPSYAVFSHIRLLKATGSALTKIERMNNRVKDGLLKFIKGMEV